MPYRVLPETPSQTAGPYLHIGMFPWAIGLPVRPDETPNVMAGPKARGERIRLEGRVIDGDGAPVYDSLVEIWQADANGKYDHPEDRQDKTPDPDFRGFGRAAADFKTGLWWFETVKPGAVPAREGGLQAPHINVAVFARGINIHLNTRIYFADETAANAADPVLRRIRPESRRQTLLAERTLRDGQVVYRFDIRLQGEGETVFLDI